MSTSDAEEEAPGIVEADGCWLCDSVMIYPYFYEII